MGKRKPREKHGAGLSLQLMSVVVGLVLMMGSLLTGVAAWRGVNTLREVTLDEFLGTANLSAQLVSQYVRQAEEDLHELAGEPELIRTLSHGADNDALAGLAWHVRTNESIGGMALADASGVIRASTMECYPPGADVSETEWFRGTTTGTDSYLGRPVAVEPTKDPQTPLGVPVVDATGRHQGVLVGYLDVGELSRTVTGLNLGPSVRSALIDKRFGGVILAHTDSARILSPVSGDNLAIARLLAGEEGVMETRSSSGELDLAAFAQVPGLPWGIIVLQPSAVGLAAAHEMTLLAALLVAVVVLFAASVSVWFGLRIAQPIGILHNATVAVASGGSGHRVAVDRRDEIGDLQRAFNGMAEDLERKEATIEQHRVELEAINWTLENRVAERTSLLEVANARLSSSEARLSSILATAADAVVCTDDSGKIVLFNKAAARIFGHGPDEALGKQMDLLVSPDTRRYGNEMMATQPLGQAVSGLRGLGLHKSGRTFPIEFSLSRSVVGNEAIWTGVMRDVSAREEMEAALRESEERFRRAFEHSGIGRAIQSLDGRYVQVNQTLCEMFGYSAEELRNKAWREIVHPADLRAAQDSHARLLSEDVPFLRWEGRYVHKSGSTAWSRVTAIVVHDADGTPLYLLEEIEDITERKRYESELLYLANNDPVTGLHSRRRFRQELQSHIEFARDRESRVGVVIIDLDHLKEINDGLGRQAGDQVLRWAGEILRQAVQGSQLLACFGGDEFAVLLPMSDAVQSQVIAQRLVTRVFEESLEMSGHVLRLTASAGVAVFPEHAATGDQLLTRAEVAMHLAKERGRNRFELYKADKDPQKQINSRRTWEHRIREALDREGFLLYAQPILDIARGTITHQELLLRMMGEDGRVIPPGEFLPVAEHLGLIRRIDRWVVRRAIELMASGAVPEGLSLEVNLSGRSVDDPELLPLIRNKLAETALDPSRLVIEITETAAITNIADARHLIESLRDMECKVALDDFGMGYSSFSILKNLPIDYLKIDGSLVREMATDNADRHMVKAIADLARALQVKSVAEFVGSKRVLDILRQQKVDYAQGYFIGQPAPITEIHRSQANSALM